MNDAVLAESCSKSFGSLSIKYRNLNFRNYPFIYCIQISYYYSKLIRVIKFTQSMSKYNTLSKCNSIAVISMNWWSMPMTWRFWGLGHSHFFALFAIPRTSQMGLDKVLWIKGIELILRLLPYHMSWGPHDTLSLHSRWQHHGRDSRLCHLDLFLGYLLDRIQPIWNLILLILFPLSLSRILTLAFPTEVELPFQSRQ